MSSWSPTPRDAFVTGMHHGVLVAAIAAFIGFLVVVRWLPARAATVDVFEEQDVEEAEIEAEAEAAARSAPPRLRPRPRTRVET